MALTQRHVPCAIIEHKIVLYSTTSPELIWVNSLSREPKQTTTLLTPLALETPIPEKKKKMYLKIQNYLEGSSHPAPGKRWAAVLPALVAS